MNARLAVRDGRLAFDGVDLTALAARVETPFYLYSQGRIAENVATLTRAFRSRHAATEVFFASKACSNLWFLEQVRAAGAGLEVNSGGELWKALEAGFAPGQIVFNGVAKTDAELTQAVEAGIRSIVADSLCELERAGEVARGLGRVAAVTPRVDVGVASSTHPGLTTTGGGKAGIDIDDALEAFRLAAAHPHLEPVGLHFHIGSQLIDTAPYEHALAVALDLLDRIEAACGLRLEHLDIGGGFAVSYRRRPVLEPVDYYVAGLDIDDYAAAVCDIVERRRPGLTLFLEPGRYVAADTGVLVSRVVCEKRKRLRDGGGTVTAEERWLLLDAGYNTLLDPVIFGWYYPLVSVSRAGEPADTPFRVAGPLCDGGDVLAGDDETRYRLLPAGSAVGDLVAFPLTGAYTLELMTGYNGRPPAGAYAVTGDGLVCIRGPETAADLVTHDRRRGEPLPGGAR